MTNFFSGFEHRRIATSGAEINLATGGSGPPLLVLWGQRSSQGSGYDVLSVRRDHAESVTGQTIPSGHFLPEEAPDETHRALRGFFAGATG
jgi:haloacetate dehalogenase